MNQEIARLGCCYMPSQPPCRSNCRTYWQRFAAWYYRRYVQPYIRLRSRSATGPPTGQLGFNDMEFPSFKCDECGRIKGEANHWFRATRLPGPRFVIVPWDTPLFRAPDPAATEQHLCGLGCATKALLRAMTPERNEELQTSVNEEVNA